MPFHQVLVLLFFIFSCLYFVTIQTRHHYGNSEHERLHHLVSHVSVPPSPAPEAAAVAGPRYSVFNVLDFGAIGDGVADDKAFKLAWDTACELESAVLLVSDGYPFMLQSTILQVLVRLLALCFRNTSKRQWLVFYRVDGMLMQGGGLVDGKGQKWWNLPCKPHKGINGTAMPDPCDSPVTIRFFMSPNLTVKGLKIKNSPQFHFRFDACHGVRVDSLTIKTPAQSPNTNGIHIENTNNVQIYNSFISNGGFSL
ncbi:Shaggy-related kinase 11, 11 isoform 1 [Hibiscus syriacus]|uniref:Shaggy-related kinase 11, 11 isoform 1 n=1 Tax=Hibiscus syriacus TaxID=106335 RepID=A0A6A3CI44_HIBSY|nr:polygalacturonase At1g48100-like [Hibiscus syriacus]KAE8728456.1 Shaggy-related kinase 11, 11 isoform 1 [Hibiscus syriacus]